MKFPEVEFSLEVLASCASTNAELMHRRERGSIHGTAILALEQTEGQGRRGRGWWTGKGNLALSMGLELDDPALLPFVPISVSLALYRVVRHKIHGRADVRLKWPNDLYLDGAKNAGLLLHARQQGALTHAVVGLGVNLVSVPPPELASVPAVALSEFGLEEAPEAFAQAIFEAWSGIASLDIPDLKAAWMMAANLASSHYEIVGEKGIWQGIGLGDSGELIVTDGNEERVLVSEDVSLRLRLL